MQRGQSPAPTLDIPKQPKQRGISLLWSIGGIIARSISLMIESAPTLFQLNSGISHSFAAVILLPSCPFRSAFFKEIAHAVPELGLPVDLCAEHVIQHIVDVAVLMLRPEPLDHVIKPALRHPLFFRILCDIFNRFHSSALPSILPLSAPNRPE